MCWAWNGSTWWWGNLYQSIYCNVYYWSTRIHRFKRSNGWEKKSGPLGTFWPIKLTLSNEILIALRSEDLSMLVLLLPTPLRFTDRGTVASYSKLLLSQVLFFFWYLFPKPCHVILCPTPAYCISLFVSETVAVKWHGFPGILFVQLHFAIWDVSKMRPKGQTLVMLGCFYSTCILYIYMYISMRYTYIHYHTLLIHYPFFRCPYNLTHR